MKLIDKAIELLRERGWIRGAEHTYQGFCLRGALRTAANLTASSCQSSAAAYGWAERACEERIYQLRGTRMSIPAWNDNYAADVDEVIGLLKLAGEDLDRQEELRTRLPLPS